MLITIYLISFLVDVFWIGGSVVLVQKYNWNGLIVAFGFFLAACSHPGSYIKLIEAKYKEKT